MAIVKFKTKIGENEFEIEAEQAVVDQKFSEFKELIGLRPPVGKNPKPIIPDGMQGSLAMVAPTIPEGKRKALGAPTPRAC